jgi:hypothetical protein
VTRALAVLRSAGAGGEPTVEEHLDARLNARVEDLDEASPAGDVKAATTVPFSTYRPDRSSWRSLPDQTATRQTAAGRGAGKGVRDAAGRGETAGNHNHDAGEGQASRPAKTAHVSGEGRSDNIVGGDQRGQLREADTTPKAGVGDGDT